MKLMMMVQGTAATVLSGLYGAMKVQGLGPEALKDQVPLHCIASAWSGHLVMTVMPVVFMGLL